MIVEISAQLEEARPALEEADNALKAISGKGEAGATRTPQPSFRRLPPVRRCHSLGGGAPTLQLRDRVRDEGVMKARGSHPCDSRPFAQDSRLTAPVPSLWRQTILPR